MMPVSVTSRHFVQRCVSVFGRGSYQVPRDTLIYCPSFEFMERDFADRLDSLTPRYVAEAYDCEDFCAEAQALMARVMAEYASQHPELPRGGNSLGYIEGVIPVGKSLNGVRDGVHATLFFLDADDVLWFFEPQPVKQRFTQAEKAMEDGLFIPRSIRP